MTIIILSLVLLINHVVIKADSNDNNLLESQCVDDSSCNNNGKCVENKICECDSNYVGSKCQFIASDYYNENDFLSFDFNNKGNEFEYATNLELDNKIRIFWRVFLLGDIETLDIGIAMKGTGYLKIIYIYKYTKNNN